jgi:hypothetical protein
MAYVNVKITDSAGNVRYQTVQTSRNVKGGHSSDEKAQRAARIKEAQARPSSKQQSADYLTPEKIQKMRLEQENYKPASVPGEGTVYFKQSEPEKPVLTADKLQEMREESLKQQGYKPVSVPGEGTVYVKEQQVQPEKFIPEQPQGVGQGSTIPKQVRYKQYDTLQKDLKKYGQKGAAGTVRPLTEKEKFYSTPGGSFWKGFRDTWNLEPDWKYLNTPYYQRQNEGYYHGAMAGTATNILTLGLAPAAGRAAGKFFYKAPKAKKVFQGIGTALIPFWGVKKGENIVQSIYTGKPSKIASSFARTGRDVALLWQFGKGMKEGARSAAKETIKVANIRATTVGEPAGKGTRTFFRYKRVLTPKGLGVQKKKVKLPSSKSISKFMTRYKGTISEYRPSWKPKSSKLVKIREVPFKQVTRGTSARKLLLDIKTPGSKPNIKIFSSKSTARGARSSASDVRSFLLEKRGKTAFKEFFQISEGGTTLSSGRFKRFSISRPVGRARAGAAKSYISSGRYRTFQQGDDSVFYREFVSRPTGTKNKITAIIKEKGFIKTPSKPQEFSVIRTSGSKGFRSLGGTGSTSTSQSSVMKALQMSLLSRPAPVSQIQTTVQQTKVSSIAPLIGFGGTKSKQSSGQVSVSKSEVEGISAADTFAISRQKPSGRSKTSVSSLLSGVSIKPPKSRTKTRPTRPYTGISEVFKPKTDTTDKSVLALFSGQKPSQSAKQLPRTSQKTPQKPTQTPFQDIFQIPDQTPGTSSTLTPRPKESISFSSFFNMPPTTPPPSEPGIISNFGFGVGGGFGGSRRGRGKSFASRRTLNPWADIGFKELTESGDKKRKKKDEEIFKIFRL